MDIEQGLGFFKIQLEADGRSPHTIAQYCRHVRLLASWAREVGHSGVLLDITHEDIARFLASSKARTRASGGVKKASTTNCLRTSLKGFFQYLHLAGYISQDPSRLTRRAICGTPPPRALSQEEQDKLLSTLAKGSGYEAQRDHLLFHLMLATGIRLGSVVGLEVDDVDLEQGELWIRKTKGNRPERVFMGQKIREHLSGYLADRHPGPLFSNRDGRALTSRQVQRRFQHWFKQAGIKRLASVHDLRHSFATLLYHRTGDILLIKEALQHRSITSTLIYARGGEDRLRRVLQV